MAPTHTHTTHISTRTHRSHVDSGKCCARFARTAHHAAPRALMSGIGCAITMIDFHNVRNPVTVQYAISPRTRPHSRPHPQAVWSRVRVMSPCRQNESSAALARLAANLTTTACRSGRLEPHTMVHGTCPADRGSGRNAAMQCMRMATFTPRVVCEVEWHRMWSASRMECEWDGVRSEVRAVKWAV
jgi:hypothetical protein